MSTLETRLTSSFFTSAALLIIAVGVLYFLHLDEDEVSSEAEARVLVTAREMNEDRTWSIPTVGGQTRWERPPLYVWTVKLASLVFTGGEVTPLASRLPGALAMSLLVLLAAWWAYQHFTAYPRTDGFEISAEGFALLSGLILATNPQLLRLARSGENDSIFALFCFTAIYCLGQSFESRRSFYAGRPWRQWVVAAYVLIGLAMLTKGPAAFLFVLIPYMAMCWTYKLRRPDPIHLLGFAVAIGLGGSWYVAAALTDPMAKQVFLDELLTRRFGSGADAHGPFYFYFELLFKAYSPWILLAGAMVYRSLRLGERTPTLVTWSCALLSGVIWLSIVGSKRDHYFLPVAPFIMLLAGDALMRWDFETNWGKAFRVLIRTLRYVMIAAGIPLAILVGSETGVVLILVVLLICIGFALHRRRTTYVYAVWERTVHGAALLVLVLGIYELVYAIDYVRRSDLRSRTQAFMTQIDLRLPLNAGVYIYDQDDSALISYYLERLPDIVYSVEDLEKSPHLKTYLVTDTRASALSQHERLVPLALRVREGGTRIRTAFLQYVPMAQAPDPLTPEQRYADVPPLRLVVLGDPGAADGTDQRAMSRRINEAVEGDPLNAVLVIGNPFCGDSLLQRIDFYRSFERPYRIQLRDGVPFLGVLSEQDQRVAWLTTRYPLIQMRGQRYYKETFYGGLVDVFALDALTLRAGDEYAAAHWKWIETELAESDALWKVVALYRPLASFSRDSKVVPELSERLLPLLNEHSVDLVLSAGEAVYQRIEDPELRPLFITAGWSGDSQRQGFINDPRLKAAFDREEGFLLIDFSVDRFEFKAINRDGYVVDSGVVDRERGEGPPNP
jgi:4-amino-4-deoxy-L-arabinose transferase-like glycosyltransferase